MSTAAVTTGDRTLTVLDHVRLDALLRRARIGPNASPLSELIAAADLVPSREVAPDIVTMCSQVVIADAADGSRRRLTLCYPADADPDAGRVSVLSPVGAALLGQRVGRVARWTTPNGELRSAEIVAIEFQPEASGDYTT
jgi:regulator of nucleoside diphosphate kinase